MSFYNGYGEEVITSMYNYEKFNGKELVVEGNSLTANVNWAYYTAQLLNMNLTNMGVGGGSITENEFMSDSSTIEGIQDNIGNRYPSKADVIIIQGDTNVGAGGDVTDQMDGSDPKSTWTARINYFIRCLKARYPNVVIVMMPDSLRHGNLEQPYDTSHTAGALNTNNRLYMKRIAEYNMVTYWEFDSATPFNPTHLDNYYSRYGDPSYPTISTQDYVHPSTSYAKAKGRALAHMLASLIFDPDAPNDAISNWTTYI